MAGAAHLGGEEPLQLLSGGGGQQGGARGGWEKAQLETGDRFIYLGGRAATWSRAPGFDATCRGQPSNLQPVGSEMRSKKQVPDSEKEDLRMIQML